MRLLGSVGNDELRELRSRAAAAGKAQVAFMCDLALGNVGGSSEARHAAAYACMLVLRIGLHALDGAPLPPAPPGWRLA